MTEKDIGIQETKDAIIATLETALAVKLALQDGKLRIDDIRYFLGAWTAILRGIRGADKIPDELEDLTVQEQEELANAVKTFLVAKGLTGEKAGRITALAMQVINFPALRDLIIELKT